MELRDELDVRAGDVGGDHAVLAGGGGDRGTSRNRPQPPPSGQAAPGTNQEPVGAEEPPRSGVGRLDAGLGRKPCALARLRKVEVESRAGPAGLIEASEFVGAFDRAQPAVQPPELSDRDRYELSFRLLRNHGEPERLHHVDDRPSRGQAVASSERASPQRSEIHQVPEQRDLVRCHLTSGPPDALARCIHCERVNLSPVEFRKEVVQAHVIECRGTGQARQTRPPLR